MDEADSAGLEHADIALFFACFPDPAAAQRAAQAGQRLRAESGLRGKLIAPERLHITLHHLGNHRGLPRQLAEAAKSAAGLVSFAAFPLTLDRAGSFAGRTRNHPAILLAGAGLEEITGLYGALGEALAARGVAQRDSRPYTPHLTLLYADRRLPQQPVEPLCWSVDAFRLMVSLRGQGRYLTLGQWPLAEH